MEFVQYVLWENSYVQYLEWISLFDIIWHFKCIYLKENFCVLIQIALKVVLDSLTDNWSALVQAIGYKPLP